MKYQNQKQNMYRPQAYGEQYGWVVRFPKSDIKRIYRVDSADRLRLYRLMLSGVNLNGLCDMLTSNDVESQKYAVEVFKQNTRSLGFFLQSVMENQEFSLRKKYIDNFRFPEKTIRRIRNIQKK